MAHVIPRKAGPRAGSDGPDTYENLILLCPTHHRKIDKAPSGTYPQDLLLRWKKAHEERVSNSMNTPKFTDKASLLGEIGRLLTENHHAWRVYGPESKAAQENPASNVAALWALRKLALVVPNNRRIISLVKKHKELFDMDEYSIACAFIEHAEGFEQNCYERTENVPRFPKSFEAMVKRT